MRAIYNKGDVEIREGMMLNKKDFQRKYSLRHGMT